MCLCGCALFQKDDPPASKLASATTQTTQTRQTTQTNHHGYALLYDLLGDEKDVSKLLIVKRERTELKTLIKEISQKSGQAHKQLSDFAKGNSQLNLKDKALPAAEVQTRSSISKAKAKELLTEKGKDFELQLLLSQNEALTYGVHLAATTAKAESDPKRAEFLQQLSGELSQLRQKVLAMLLEHYSWAASK